MSGNTLAPQSMADVQKNCLRMIGESLLNSCGDVSALNEPFAGRPFPGNPSVRRGVKFEVDTQRLLLSDVAIATPVPQYASRAEGFDNPRDALRDDNAIVAQITIPAGFQVQTAKAFVYISDPELTNAVTFGVYNGKDNIVSPWDGALRTEVDIPVGGDLAIGGKNITFSVRAIVNPIRWSTVVAGVPNSGSNPLRSLICAYARLEVNAIANVPNGMIQPC